MTDTSLPADTDAADSPHYLRALTDMADKVIKMKNGKVRQFIINDNPVPVERIEW